MSSTEPTPARPTAEATPPVTDPEPAAEPTTGLDPDLTPDGLADADLALYREHLRAVTAPDPAVEAGLLSRVGAEVLGTFALVVVTLAIALYSPFSGVGTLGTALGAGLVLVGATAALGRVSGGHFNPAVTLGATLAGRLSWLELPAYWLAQVVGGVVAGAVVFLTIPATFPGVLQVASTRAFMGTTANGWDAHSPLSTLSQGQLTFDLRAALAVELVAALVLVAVYLGTTRHLARGRALDADDASSRALAPAAIGVTYAALLLVAAPVTGGSVNPARSTAAALFSEASAAGQLWLFWVAPLVGAALAGLGYVLFARPSREQELGAFLAAEQDEDDEPEMLDVTPH